jgi:lactoylglutathione lyase
LGDKVLAFEGHITFIYTRDMDRAVAFYEGVMELPVVMIQDGGCRLYKTGSGAYLGVCRERPGRVSTQEGLVLCFVDQDVEGWHERLVKGGAEIVQAPGYSDAFKVFNLFFRDPDGHLLEVQRFDDPDWHQPLA